MCLETTLVERRVDDYRNASPLFVSRIASRPKCGICALLAVLCGSSFAHAQDEQRRIERILRPSDERALGGSLSLSLTERTPIDVGGYLSLVGLHLTDANDNAHRLFQPEVGLYARATIDNTHSFFVRSRFQYRDFGEGDSFDGEGDGWSEPFVDRFWYEIDMTRAFAADTVDPNHSLRVRIGRQFIDWGAGLALSENLYAIRPVMTLDRWTFDAVAGITPSDESVVDFDTSRNQFNTNTRRGFFGGRVAYRTPSNHEFYGYYLRMQDYNDDLQHARATVIPGKFDFEYNGNYFGVGARGSFSTSLLYLAEFVYETGESQSDPLRSVQRAEDISAYAARAQLTYLLRDKNRSRVEGELLLASGDDDRLVSTDTIGGNLRGSNDTGFNSLGYVNTGLAFSPALSNLVAVRVGGSTFPLTDVNGLDRLQIGADLLVSFKLDSDAPIDEATDPESYLGTELDFSLNYAVTSDLSLTARYGVFFGGDAITAADTRHFVFVGLTLSF